MSKTEANSPTSLSTMLGSGEPFEVNEKSYIIRPIKLKHVDEFMKDGVSIDAQLFNLRNPEARARAEKWLSGYCLDQNGENMTIDKAMEDDWDVVHLKNFFRKLCDLSG